MRDRVASEKIDDLTALLQRDLNDDRVANELVPYLRNANLGFFPSILAVLVPKSYLTNSGATYPKPELSDLTTSYEGKWSIEQYEMGSEAIPLGLLKITLDQADIIVLDGQHRTNAFRYLSGDFDPKDVYKIFYDKAGEPIDLDADLPVTIVWFESENELDPILISRRLFVDVNNNAQEVSQSRTFLLNDSEVRALIGRSLYQLFAKRRFCPDKISLLHSCFDVDVDYETANKVKSSLHLTLPEVVVSACQCALLGGPTGRAISTRVIRDNRDDRLDVIWDMEPRFRESLSLIDRRAHIKSSSDSLAEFTRWCEESVAKPLLNIFDKWQLLQPHFVACSKLEEWIDQHGSSHNRSAWEKIFKGGEGLYWALMKIGEGDVTSNQRAYKKSVSEVESKFLGLRAEAYGYTTSQLNPLFRVVSSSAFHSGLFQSIAWLVENGTAENFEEGAQQVIDAFNDHTNDQWVEILSRIRAKMIQGDTMSPKDWPVVRDIVILIVERHMNQDFFGTLGNDVLGNCLWPRNKSTLKLLGDYVAPPECHMLRMLFSNEIGSLLDYQSESPTKVEIEDLLSTTVQSINDDFERSGLRSRLSVEEADIAEIAAVLVPAIEATWAALAEE